MSKRSATNPAGPAVPHAAEPPLLSAPLRWGLLAGLVLTVGGAIWYLNAPGKDELSRSLQRAQDALKSGNLPEAYALYQKVLPHVPPSAKVPESLAEMAIRLHQFDDVDQWLNQMPADEAAVASRIQMSAASSALELGHVTRAESWLRKLLRPATTDMGQAEAARQMLIRLFLMTLRDRDLRELIATTDRTPENSLAGDLLLQYCVGTRSNAPDRANRAWLQNALLQEPRNASVRAALASLLLRTNQREAGHELLRQGIEQEEAAPSARSEGVSNEVWRLKVILAQDLIENGQFEPGAVLLSSLPEPAEFDPHVWISRGRIAAERKDSAAARAAFATAAALDPTLPDAAYQLARLAQGIGTAELARENFRRRDLLDRLYRAATRVRNTPRERQAALQDAASVTAQLGMPRLSLLLCRALAVEHSESPETQAKLKELEALPAARQLLSATASPILPDKRRFQPSGTAPRNAANSTPDATPVDGMDRTPAFHDVAESTGLKFRNRFAETSNHWLMETLGAGVAVLDFDNDGWPDVFCPQGSALPVPSSGGETAALFRNVRGQKFEEVPAASGLAPFGFGQGCAVGDFDNDGWPDVLVCFYGSIRLYRNNGDGTFHDATSSSGLTSSQWSTSAAFGDFDRDGDLDLYVVNYVVAPWESIRPCDRGGPAAAGTPSTCRPTDYPAAQDSVWENRGDGTFVERTAAAGIVAADGKGLAVIVEDFNNDGWPDVYVANDMTPNHLFQNLGRASGKGESPFSFIERGVAAGAALSGQGEAQSSMGVACGDADGDGNFDLFVTNFQEETNTYYRNLGGGKNGEPGKSHDVLFSDETAKAQLLDLNPPKMGWGCQFVDSLGRGRSDLFLLNGHLLHTPQTPTFYANEGERFRELRLAGSYFQTERMGRALALLDWNRDLKPDFVATYLKGNISLLTNDSKAGHSLGLELVGRNSNRDAEGARIIVHVGTGRRAHRVSRGGGFFAANEKTVFIGLGDAQAIDRWEILWPGAPPQTGGRLEAGVRYRVIEGQEPRIVTSP